MKAIPTLADLLPALLWGKRARLSHLLIAAIILLFAFLGAREIWTQEQRWADIVLNMFQRHDFFHPYLGDKTYYDKPLLSYWLIAMVTKISGEFSLWSMRLPSALAGLLAVFSIYRIGRHTRSHQMGLLAGWMLITTYFFIFWARTSSADMLNLAGCLLAIAWYLDKREQARFFDFAVFFMIVAVTALCKGLIGVVIPAIAVLIDVMLNKKWRKYFNLQLFLAIIPALAIYLTPFIVSSLVGGETYQQNGLYLVYRENILRFFQPFDHRGSVFTYFIYLPIYLMPWSILLIPATVAAVKDWKNKTLATKWLALTLLTLFVFFTMSGSRRSYYVLPLIPIAILYIADWLCTPPPTYRGYQRHRFCAYLAISSFVLLFLILDAIPAWYYPQYGVSRFATLLKQHMAEVVPPNPSAPWTVVALDVEHKLNFYLPLDTAQQYTLNGKQRANQTTATLLAAWPMLQERLKQQPNNNLNPRTLSNTIYITRKQYEALLQPLFEGYRILEVKNEIQLPFSGMLNQNKPIAFVPDKF